MKRKHLAWAGVWFVFAIISFIFGLSYNQNAVKDVSVSRVLEPFSAIEPASPTVYYGNGREGSVGRPGGPGGPGGPGVGGLVGRNVSGGNFGTGSPVLNPQN